MDFNFPSNSDDNTMRYILYDLRKDSDPLSALAKVHLPTSEDTGPVLLRVKKEQYEDVVAALREMCFNEGDEWMTTMLVRPEYAPTNTGDLEINGTYIMVAHVELFMDEPEDFMYKLRSMKRLVFH